MFGLSKSPVVEDFLGNFGADNQQMEFTGRTARYEGVLRRYTGQDPDNQWELVTDSGEVIPLVYAHGADHLGMRVSIDVRYDRDDTHFRILRLENLTSDEAIARQDGAGESRTGNRPRYWVQVAGELESSLDESVEQIESVIGSHQRQREILLEMSDRLDLLTRTRRRELETEMEEVARASIEEITEAKRFLAARERTWLRTENELLQVSAIVPEVDRALVEMEAAVSRIEQDIEPRLAEMERFFGAFVGE